MSRKSRNALTQDTKAKRLPFSKAAARKTSKGATRTQSSARPSSIPSPWLSRLLIATGSVVVLAAAFKAYVSLQAIPVQHIVVKGELENTRNEMIQDMVQPALVGGFLYSDLQRIRTQLEALPWIYRATVQRRWPDALEIHVIEQLPIARWGNSDFLNHEGDVFRSGDNQQWQDLPNLQGPAGSAKALVSGYKRIADILKPLQMKVASLKIDERGQIDVVMNNGMQLKLGNEDFLERMHRFLAVYRSDLSNRAADIERIDLRYETGVAVAFKQEPPQVAGL
ncbi:MAG: cell division protein FtsQ/DivIB [Pseudomonadota bacterium]